MKIWKYYMLTQKYSIYTSNNVQQKTETEIIQDKIMKPKICSVYLII